jgi:hypothetical protein
VPHDPPNAPPDGAACDLLVANVGQLVTPEGACGDGPLRGARHSSLRVVPRAALAVRGGRVVWAGPSAEWRGDARATLDAGGAAVVPGLVDPHTHLVWAGDRLDDFEARARGEGYEAILARGGGIRHTVRRTAAAPVDALVALARPRLDALVRSGATTVEVKSGYGLTPDAELRMLEAVAALRAHSPAELAATLLFHLPPADPAERRAYVDDACARVVPQVAAAGLAEAVDVFVEREAFTVDEAARLVGAAAACGPRREAARRPVPRVRRLGARRRTRVCSASTTARRRGRRRWRRSPRRPPSRRCSRASPSTSACRPPPAAPSSTRGRPWRWAPTSTRAPARCSPPRCRPRSPCGSTGSPRPRRSSRRP